MISRPDSGASVVEDISNEHQDYRQVMFKNSIFDQIEKFTYYLGI
jgi:hypothetical protein